MKTTTRLYDIIRDAFIQHKNENKDGYNFVSFTRFNDNFMVEMATETDTAYNVLLNNIYQGSDKILDSEIARKFLFEFNQRFLTRTIKFQTIDLFRLHFLAEIKARESIIKAVYGDNKNKYIEGVETSKSISDSTDENTNKATSSSLPQAMTDIDNIDFADSLDQNDNEGKAHSEQTSTNSNFTVDAITDFANLKNKLFAELDQKLFSQVF